MCWCFDGFRQDPGTGALIPATDARGRPVTDWRTDPVWRRSPSEVLWLLRRSLWAPHAMLPHVQAVGAGFALYLAVLLDVPGPARLAS